MLPTAYFSAEIGYSADIPSYAGGLGILAGDHLKSAADLGLPVVAVTLLYREGYFVQHLDPDGTQSASYPRFDPEDRLTRLDASVDIRIAERDVRLAIWRADLVGRGGHKVPILLLDTDIEDNHPDDRRITHRLYGGDKGMRLRQEMVLGFGGMAAVRQLHPQAARFHLNEGHCAFAMLALLRQGMSLAEVQRAGHFTTHTPVPAGHDTFPYALVRECFGELFGELGATLPQLAGRTELSMSHLALNTCGTANGVSKLHGQVSRDMFPEHDIGHVTNGVHHLTWVSPPMARLYDAHARGWREDPQVLATARLPGEALWQAHLERKREMLAYVGAQEARGYAESLCTIGFARRATAYKRAELLFSDLDRLAQIGAGRLQLVFAGKAHPMDTEGQATIRRIVAAGRALAGQVRVSYIPNYTMWTGALLTSGADVWLNTPRRPREASGTSGMKAILNAVPNASIADGWWDEGAKHGVNGWVIDGASAGGDARDGDSRDAEALYRVLENDILPAWENRDKWLDLMRGASATGAQFTAERMVKEYRERYYSEA